ncbi:MAG: hypothetical protein JJU42_13265 [Rhodobacteraceae bacterium]|nr:hypothetical protein [Paracoccaceae bacterium]
MQNETQGIFGSLGARMKSPLTFLGAQTQHDEENDRVIRRFLQLSDPRFTKTPARSVFRH